MKCRLATVGMDNTVENRQAWRELLYSAPGLGNVSDLLRCPSIHFYCKHGMGCSFMCLRAVHQRHNYVR